MPNKRVERYDPGDMIGSHRRRYLRKIVTARDDNRVSLTLLMSVYIRKDARLIKQRVDNSELPTFLNINSTVTQAIIITLYISPS